MIIPMQNDYIDIAYKHIMSNSNLFSLTRFQLDSFLKCNVSIHWKNYPKIKNKIINKVINYKPKPKEICEASLMQKQLMDRYMHIKYQKYLLSQIFPFSYYVNIYIYMFDTCLHEN